MSTRSRRRGRGRVALALAAALAGSCGEDPPPERTGTPGYASAPAAEGPAPEAESPTASFEDAAREMGVDFVHENGARGRKYLPETMGSGVAVLDYDGDGWMDLFFVNATTWPWDAPAERPPTARLFRNRGDGTFEDATDRAGLAEPRFGIGVAVADYDADGDPDLFVTGVGPCALYRNDGGRFTEVAAAAGVAGEPWTDESGAVRDPVWSAAAFFDYDGDGVLDLYACRYVRWSRENDVFTSMDGKNKAYTVPTRYQGDSGRLYRGRGDGTFEDRTEAAGVWSPDAKALGVAASDLDGDGDVDLVVANDTQPNHLFLNAGDGTFRECGLEAGLAYDAMGKARADMGIAVGEVEPGDAAYRPVILTGTFSQESLSCYRPQPRAKRLTFVDEGPRAGIAGPTFPVLTFGVLLQDLDLDGLPDLFLANGHIEPTIQEIMADTPYAQAPQFFRNLGDGRFRDESHRAGPALREPCVGRGLAWGDLDGDGDPDLVVSSNGGRARILRNTAPAGRRSLRLRLENTGGNRDAVGARVAVDAGGRTLVQERVGGGSYCSASEPTLLFGLGEAASADGVRVTWPGGAVEDLGPLAAGLWKVRRGEEPVRLGD